MVNPKKRRHHTKVATSPSKSTTAILIRKEQEHVENDSSKTKNNDKQDGNDDDQQTWSKSKKKRMRKLRAKLQQPQGNKNEIDDTKNGKGQIHSGKKKMKKEQQEVSSYDDDVDDDQAEQPAAKRIKTSTTTALQDSFKARLTGSRFRILNEELYTTTSTESFKRFSSNPDLFEQYHEGFRHQVESWPVNPVDVIVRSILSSCSKKNIHKKNKNKKQEPCVIADFGCGDAQLAKDLLATTSSNNKNNSFTIHSFDLVSKNHLVTPCDMANVPLEDKSCDICVFCLSLMGTNLADFIREAHRVLKDDGRVKIAEVRSRIEYCHSQQKKKKQNSNKANKDKEKKSSGTLNEFVDILDQLGFECVKKDLSNKMFLVLELQKNGRKPNEDLAFSAKPCIYKRR